MRRNIELGGIALLVLALGWSQSVLAERIELRQEVEFKWQTFTVATMEFAVSIPATNECIAAPADAGASDSQIRIIGKTKGPLRWMQDYQATVEYLRSKDIGAGSAFRLQGTDNGDPEQRAIRFFPDQLPAVEIFNDSTAAEPLIPSEEWAGNTENPLAVFAAILQSAVQGRSCAYDTWGFDGKRRYRLQATDRRAEAGALQGVSEPEASAQVTSDTPRPYQCALTLYAQGRQTAGNPEHRDVPGWKSRFASLWPFSDTDREIVFHLGVSRSLGGEPSAVTLQKIVIPTSIGAIVAKAP